MLITIAVPDANAIGANALNEKWRNIASWAKIMPVKGALKPADIAAATPPPRTISVLIRSLRIALSHEPSVAPKCTNGLY